MVDKKYHCSQCGKETEILNYCTCYVCGLSGWCPKCKKRKISVVNTTRHLIPKKLVNPEDLKCFKCGNRDGKILDFHASRLSCRYRYCCEECLFNGKTENCICDFGGKGWRKCTTCGDTFEFKSLCGNCFQTFSDKEAQEKLRTRGVMDFVKDNWVWIAGVTVAVVGLVLAVFLWKKRKK